MISSRLDPSSTLVRPQKPWTSPFYVSMNGSGLKTLHSTWFLISPASCFHFSKPNHASTDQNLRILLIISLLAYWWNPYLDAWTILATPHWIFGPDNFQHVWHFISIKWVMIQHSTTFLQQIFGGKY